MMLNSLGVSPVNLNHFLFCFFNVSDFSALFFVVVVFSRLVTRLKYGWFYRG